MPLFTAGLKITSAKSKTDVALSGLRARSTERHSMLQPRTREMSNVA